jgi:putative ATP-binding cassette transporter
MFWLSPPLFLFNLCFLFITLTIYNIPAKMARRYLAHAREISDETIKQFRFLTEGLKELFIHRRKRQEFLNRHLHASNEELMNRNIRAMSAFIISRRIGEFLVLANLGFLLFLLSPLFKVEAHILSGFILACLFTVSPMSSLSMNFAEWVRVNVALEKIQTYGFDLFKTNVIENAGLFLHSTPLSDFDQLILEDVKFDYLSEFYGDQFVVGPVNFHLKSGELTFLIGGNGSGKTTLAKIICGLYSPMEGRILWNNELINNTNRERFQQNFSVVFSDFFLFKYLIGIDPNWINAQADDYLNTLDLKDKVTIQNGAFSTTDLSHGQRKRLALMASCLENRPVYIFDEWAAGQAPAFKKIFYEEILMSLKRMNKMVLVITHDEKYFHVADRLIKIEDGKIE